MQFKASEISPKASMDINKNKSTRTDFLKEWRAYIIVNNAPNNIRTVASVNPRATRYIQVGTINEKIMPLNLLILMMPSQRCLLFFLKQLWVNE